MNSKTLKRHPELVFLLLLLIAGCGFFGLTDPAKVPTPLLIVAFAVVFANVYLILRLCVRVLGVRTWLSRVQYRLLTLGAAVFLVFLLALQSIGQLTMRDIITLTALFGAGCFYMMRLTRRQ